MGWRACSTSLMHCGANAARSDDGRRLRCAGSRRRAAGSRGDLHITAAGTFTHRERPLPPFQSFLDSEREPCGASCCGQSARARPRTASRRHSSRPCAPPAAQGLESAGMGPDDRPSQGPRRAPRPRAPAAADGRPGHGRRWGARDPCAGMERRSGRRPRATASCGRRSSDCPRAGARRSCFATWRDSPVADRGCNGLLGGCGRRSLHEGLSKLRMGELHDELSQQ